MTATNADTVLNSAIADLALTFDEMKKLESCATALLDAIKPLLIGKRVKLHGHIYQITQVRVHFDHISASLISCYGVRVRGDKIGTRGYALYGFDPTKLLS